MEANWRLELRHCQSGVAIVASSRWNLQDGHDGQDLLGGVKVRIKDQRLKFGRRELSNVVGIDLEQRNLFIFLLYSGKNRRYLAMEK